MLWVFVAANAVNFMDGSDGLIVAIFVPVGLALGLTGEGAGGYAGYALAAGLAGFATFNVPRAFLFLGDVGSLAIGGVFAAIALQLIETPGEVWLYPLLILPVLGDVLLTLGAALGGVALFAMFAGAVVVATLLHAGIRRQAIRSGLDLKA